jgi:type IV secretory pathway VirB2 component (pilin)
VPTMADNLLDPSSSSPLFAAAQWFELLFSGSLAAALATIAVAAMGLLMLAGRVDIRRGALTLLGCFILFGASAIASGLRVMSGNNVAPASLTTTAPPSFPPSANSGQTSPYDPYSGAAVPR